MPERDTDQTRMTRLSILEGANSGGLSLQDGPSPTLTRRYRVNLGGNCLVILSARRAVCAKGDSPSAIGSRISREREAESPLAEVGIPSLRSE